MVEPPGKFELGSSNISTRLARRKLRKLESATLFPAQKFHKGEYLNDV